MTQDESNKGWKVFNKDMTCRDFQFEVGKTYEHNGPIEMCSSGFHFHKTASHLFTYYPFDPDKVVVCEIEYNPKNVKHGDDKSVTGEITIVRKLLWAEVLEVCNSGYCNSGYGNSGDGNSGDRNSGYRNSGNWNSGNRNSGNRNSGNWNSGYRNSGYLCVSENKILIFDEPVPNGTNFIWPDFFYFDVVVFVSSNKMTDEEKKAHPYYETTGGYSKTLKYKEAWRLSWDKASDTDRRKVLSIPNWDNKKFKIITGIDVHKELGVIE